MTEPTPRIMEALAQWHRCVEQKDMTQLHEILADDVQFHSPFIWKPKQGKKLAVIVLSAAAQVLENLTYHRQMTDGTTWALEFSARIGETSVDGMDIIRFNAEGRITDFKVLIRPFKALQAAAAAMEQQLVAQGDYETYING